MKKSAITAIDEHSIVRKSNQLNEALSRLSVADHRLLAILISAIDPMDDDVQLHTFTARQLAELCDIQERDNYKAIRKTVSGLIHKSVVIQEDDGGFHEYPWLHQGVYYPKKGLISMQIHPNLKPYVLQLQSKYVQYNLFDVLQLKSKYSFRLFELLKQYAKIKERKFEVGELRNALGIEKNELILFADFKKRAIEPAIKEVNGKTSILIEAEYVKTGRAISHLIFKIQEKSQIPDIKEILEPADQTGIEDLLNLIPDSLKNLKATRSRLIKALQRHDAAYIKQQIEYTNKKNPKKESYLNYLGKAIDDNYAELETELSEEKKKLNEAEREKKLAEYRLMSDKDIKDLAERGNDYAKTILYERAQTTINWTVEAQAEPAQAPVESADSIWTDDQLAEMAAGGNARAQAILSERIRAQIPR